MASSKPLIVLTDSDVQNILGNLERHEIELMQKSLRSALHEYSTGHQDQPECHWNQKERMMIENQNGTSTLVMPARSSAGMSMKGLSPLLLPFINQSNVGFQMLTLV